MKIKELLYKTPEMTEEKLLEIMKEKLPMLKNKTLVDRINQLYHYDDIPKSLLNEYDLIQDKKSNLTKSQRDIVVGFVGLCMIYMVKGNEGTEN